MPTKFKVSKLDTARRQLETAIRLYFSEADPVSIHTLMSAAYQVLMDINRIQGGSPMIKDAIPTWVRPDATKEARDRLNEAANFFKHADRDHDEVLEFSLAPTELLLYDAVRKYRELTGELVPVLAVYDAWFWIGPGLPFVTTTEHERVRDEVRQAFPNATRGSFFREALAMVSSIGS
ncbi:MAG: hypothetical protein Q7J25_12600 [Vicinamibacterales bacterium]|nr:hypothetical protein [Vicinamibacterales bacterium]